MSPFISISSLFLPSALAFLGHLASVASSNLHPSAFPGITLVLQDSWGSCCPEQAVLTWYSWEEVCCSHIVSQVTLVRAREGGGVDRWGWGWDSGLHWPPPLSWGNISRPYRWVGGRPFGAQLTQDKSLCAPHPTPTFIHSQNLPLDKGLMTLCSVILSICTADCGQEGSRVALQPSCQALLFSDLGSSSTAQFLSQESLGEQTPPNTNLLSPTLLQGCKRYIPPHCIWAMPNYFP